VTGPQKGQKDPHKAEGIPQRGWKNPQGVEAEAAVAGAKSRWRLRRHTIARDAYRALRETLIFLTFFFYKNKK
jgi:hypothetical protein